MILDLGVIIGRLTGSCGHGRGGAGAQHRRLIHRRNQSRDLRVMMRQRLLQLLAHDLLHGFAETRLRKGKEWVEDDDDDDEDDDDDND